MYQVVHTKLVGSGLTYRARGVNDAGQAGWWYLIHNFPNRFEYFVSDDEIRISRDRPRYGRIYRSGEAQL